MEIEENLFSKSLFALSVIHHCTEFGTKAGPRLCQRIQIPISCKKLRKRSISCKNRSISCKRVEKRSISCKKAWISDQLVGSGTVGSQSLATARSSSLNPESVTDRRRQLVWAWVGRPISGPGQKNPTDC